MPSSNPVANLFRHLWKYSKGNRGKVVLFIFLELSANIFKLAEPVVVSRAFNSVQFGASDPKLLTNIVFNLVLLLAIILIYWALHGLSRVIEISNAFSIRKKYKEDMINKVLSLPLGWHKSHHSGETIDKINKSAEGLFNFSGSTFLINLSTVRIFGSLIAIFIFDKWAALIAGVVTVIAISIVWRFDVYLRKTYLEIHKSENYLASAIHDYITNIFSIITLRLKNRVEREVSDRGKLAYPAFRKQTIVNEGKWFSVAFFTTLMTTVVLSINAYISYKTNGVIVIGTLFALYTYLQAIGGVFANFAMQYGQMVQNDAALRSAFPINEAYDNVSHDELSDLPKNWKKLEIKDLSFTYTANQETDEPSRQLEDISITINHAEKIAFIGESGSGKSTMLSVLRGLYRPQHVEVFCDEVKLSDGLARVHNHTTLVPQEPELFNSTVLDNITMDTKVEDSELNQMIDLAQFRSVLERLPKGLETHVLEKGISLSGGEKQRLALARGLLAGRQSDFLFLDEPTSSVDFTNEMKIYENVISTFKDKTIISTVHNLSLLKYFDQVYLFGKGKLIAHGTFEELLKNDQFRTVWDNYNKTLM